MFFVVLSVLHFITKVYFHASDADRCLRRFNGQFDADWFDADWCLDIGIAIGLAVAHFTLKNAKHGKKESSV